MTLGTAFRRYDTASQTPGLDVAAMQALLRGLTPRDVAELYGTNERTAYRWRRDLEAIEVVRVGGWVASFARRRGKQPIRVTEWAVEKSWTELGDKPLPKRGTVSDNRCVEHSNTGDHA